jgi:hypothetical protein
MKLKYHRLKPGGVPTFFPIFVVMKFKDHRLKPGGVLTTRQTHIGLYCAFAAVSFGPTLDM